MLCKRRLAQKKNKYIKEEMLKRFMGVGIFAAKSGMTISTTQLEIHIALT